MRVFFFRPLFTLSRKVSKSLQINLGISFVCLGPFLRGFPLPSWLPYSDIPANYQKLKNEPSEEAYLALL